MKLAKNSPISEVISPRGGYVFTHIRLFGGWLVGLSLELHKNYSVYFHDTWMEDWSQARIDPINC